MLDPFPKNVLSRSRARYCLPKPVLHGSWAKSWLCCNRCSQKPHLPHSRRSQDSSLLLQVQSHAPLSHAWVCKNTKKVSFLQRNRRRDKTLHWPCRLPQGSTHSLDQRSSGCLQEPCCRWCWPELNTSHTTNMPGFEVSTTMLSKESSVRPEKRLNQWSKPELKWEKKWCCIINTCHASYCKYSWSKKQRQNHQRVPSRKSSEGFSKRLWRGLCWETSGSSMCASSWPAGEHSCSTGSSSCTQTPWDSVFEILGKPHSQTTSMKSSEPCN